jgi:hypothetical protein
MPGGNDAMHWFLRYLFYGKLPELLHSRVDMPLRLPRGNHRHVLCAGITGLLSEEGEVKCK